MKVITFNPNVYKLLTATSTKMHETPSQTVTNLIEYMYECQQNEAKGAKTTPSAHKKVRTKNPTEFPANSITLTDAVHTKLEKFAEKVKDHPLAVASFFVVQDWLSCETHNLESVAGAVMDEVDSEIPLPLEEAPVEKKCEHEKKCKDLGKPCKKCDK